MKRDSKSRVTDHTREGKIADVALAAAIILAPVLGGGSNLTTIPLITLATLIAAGGTYLAAKRLGSSIHFTWLSMGLVLLALFTLFQAIPLPAGLAGFLSPASVELRAFD